MAKFDPNIFSSQVPTAPIAIMNNLVIPMLAFFKWPVPERDLFPSTPVPLGGCAFSPDLAHLCRQVLSVLYVAALSFLSSLPSKEPR